MDQRRGKEWVGERVDQFGDWGGGERERAAWVAEESLWEMETKVWCEELKWLMVEAQMLTPSLACSTLSLS